MNGFTKTDIFFIRFCTETEQCERVIDLNLTSRMNDLSALSSTNQIGYLLPI